MIATLLLTGNVGGRTHKRSKNRATQPQAFDAASINNVDSTKGDPAFILRAQILLDRAHFSPGEIDANAGVNFHRAVSGFQESRKLPVTGELDAASWAALTADTSSAIIPYRITDTDVAGPFVQVPKELPEQSTLKTLGYSNVEEALGEQFHVSPSVLRKLNPGLKFAAGDEIQVPNISPGISGVKAAKVTVSKAGYVQVHDASGQLLAQYPSSSGSEHDPLPIGIWKITGVSRNPNSTTTRSCSGTRSRDPKSKIAPGPNNPVGVVWIDLTKTTMGSTALPNLTGRAHTIAWMYPADQLGCDGVGRHGRSRHACN